MSIIIDGLKLRSTLLLQRGDEGYGVASTVTEFSKVLVKNNFPLNIVCVTEGDLCIRLRRAGLTVEVLGIPPPPKVINGNLPRRAMLLARSKTAQKRIAEAVIDKYNGESIDVVQTMNFLLLESCGQISRSFGATGVWRMPSGVQSPGFKKIKQVLMTRVCEKYGLVSMANSDFTQRSIARDSPQSVFVHHGCDATRFCPDTVIPYARDSFGIADGDVVFGIFAQIHSNGEKGQLLAVQALVSYLERRNKNMGRIHLILLGGPTDSQVVVEMRTLADTCEMLSLHLLGGVSDVERYYGLIDVSLSTRLTPEPFGLSVIESMMMGVPVLAHALGGPAETIIDGSTGWLVDNTSVEEWVGAFERVIGDMPRWLEYSKRARSHALNNFTIDAELKGWSSKLDILA